jgi:hypothetical protein
MSLKYILIGCTVAAVSLFLGWLLGRPKKPNAASGKIFASFLKDLTSAYVQISTSSGEVLVTTSVITKDSSETKFLFPFYNPKFDFLVFDVFKPSHGEPSYGDPKLGSFDIASDTVIDTSPIHKEFKLDSLVLGVEIKRIKSHSWSLGTSRTLRRLGNMFRQISFFARFLIILGAVALIAFGMDRFSKEKGFARWQGLYQVICGLYFVCYMVPFLLAALGIKLLDNWKQVNLSFAWGQCFAVTGTVAFSKQWCKIDKNHFAEIWIIIIAGILLVLADLRGEPGASWLQYPGKILFGSFSYKEY